MALRWGIASAGKISHDFVNALSTLPESDHRAIAVAAKDLSRAQAFAKLHNIKSAYSSYKELAQDPDVEIVYIGSLNPQHLEIGKLMLENGKHVLCEKPLTMNKKQSQELIDMAKKKGLFLMEAIWSRCFPLYDMVKKKIAAGIIGDPKHVMVSFGFKLDDVERLTKKSQGGGTILDLGVYTIQLVSWIFNGERPKSIKATGHLNKEGVDMSMAATLQYDNERLATIMTSGFVCLPNEAIVVGTKGTIRIPNFWCPISVEFPSGNVDSPLPEARIPFNFINSAGLRFEAEEARICIRSGKTESTKVSHAESLLIADIEDELRRQLGVVYDVD